jgi:hypothetical protein
MPGGKIAAHLLHFLFDGIGRIQGIGAGGLADGHGGGGLAVVIGHHVIALGAQFRAADVADPDHTAVRVGADGDGGKLLGGLEQVLDDDGSIQALAFHGRGPAELAGGNLHVVDLQGPDDVFHGQMKIGQFVRVDPDPHGVLGAEGFDLAHPRHPGENLFQVGLGVVAQIVAVHAAVFGNQADDDQVVAGRFADLDALALDHVRQAGHGQLELVLHLGPGQVRVGARGEGQLDARGAGGRTFSGKVEHVGQAGHFLFDDLGHRVFHGFRRCAGVIGFDGDGRRGDGRILGYGQVVDGQPSGAHHDDGDHPGKDRSVQEEF